MKKLKNIGDTHTHTHTHTSSCCHVLWARSVGYCHRGRLGWRVAARHPGRSIISSCHSLTPERSLFTRSLHRSDASPGGLLLPDGQHLISSFWMRWQIFSRDAPTTVSASASTGLLLAAPQFLQGPLCYAACSSG